jgi:hypothetical protein
VVAAGAPQPIKIQAAENVRAERVRQAGTPFIETSTANRRRGR